MDMHKLLKRQLNRLGLQENAAPNNEKWQEFVASINRFYIDSEQENYLVQRSMEISSREMYELNEKLAAAQHMAKLGYWMHDLENNKNSWSKEVYKLSGMDPAMPAPSIERVIKFTHPKDQEKLKDLMDKILKTGEEKEIEMRLTYFGKIKGEYRWFRVIGHGVKNSAGVVTVITGVVMDITSKKHTEEELNSLHEKLITSARRAGMADVATAILHNVGNILNSVNVSINLMNEKIALNFPQKMEALSAMFSSHQANLSEYLTHDEKGRMLPDYLQTLTKKLKTNYDGISEEIKNLNEQIQHIKDITQMQKVLSGLSGLNEKVFLPELIDSAIKMGGQTFEKNHVQVVKEVKPNIFVNSDKNKILQILVNLIQNAKDAVLETNNSQKKILITVLQPDSDHVQICVADNGSGIHPDALTKIFSFGFTTKKDGHGFGLHSSALSAKELGGKLEVKSQGPSTGATFILTIPSSAPLRRSEHEHQEEQLTHHSD